MARRIAPDDPTSATTSATADGLPVRSVPGGVELDVRVQPGASRAALAGLHAGRIKIRIAAPPVDGKANEALVEFVARSLGIRTTRVELRSGTTSRSKRLHVADVGLGEVREWLESGGCHLPG